MDNNLSGHAPPTCDETNVITPPIRGTDRDIVLKRFDYTWDWFKVHAKQRTDMFNYFLLTTGLLANAYVNLRKDNHWVAAGAVAVTGLFTAYGFALLDVRNKFLVDKAAAILDKIEQELIFNTASLKDKGLSQIRLDRTRPSKSDVVNSFYHHKTVFRGIYYVVSGMWIVFLGGVILFWSRTSNSPLHLIDVEWKTAALLAAVQIFPAIFPPLLLFFRIRSRRKKKRLTN